MGPCRALIPSYYYDRYTQSCLPFTYGGCRGNANNFETWEACDEACRRIESKSRWASARLLRGPFRRRAAPKPHFPDPLFYSEL